MKFCENCKKETPTNQKRIGYTGKFLDECMICGNILGKSDDSKVKTNYVKNLKKIVEINNVGKYKNAQTVGRNVMIGFLIILAGILYSYGGFQFLLFGVVSIFLLLLFIAIVLYLLALVT